LKSSLSLFVETVSSVAFKSPLTHVTDPVPIVREEFESKKEEYETTIAGLLGFPVTISLDVNAICAYADLSSASVGTLLAG
jgi:hypothetical protein